ncbi:MAG: beta-hexosaminidase, partial [Propionibacterium sp.]
LDTNNSGVAEIDKLTSEIRNLGSTKYPTLIAVDQEGGVVQRLKGVGFDDIPSALEQSKLSDKELTKKATTWGKQLLSAGVHFNLAPVADVVPEDKISSNAPIGKLRRGYGSDPKVVAEKTAAFITGMSAAGVATSAKHFPGLGQASANTDHAAATDKYIKKNDPSWVAFKGAIDAGVSSVMMSSAVYTKIDPKNKAIYSSIIINDILRKDMQFDKVIISDDVGAAKALADVPIAERGTRFLVAGGDLVINADIKSLPKMIDHTIAKAESDPKFANQITRSAARVTELAASVLLVDCGQ